MIECEACGHEFDPVATRWLCPYCGRKHHCCDHHRLQWERLQRIAPLGWAFI
jgi:predicted RNA-binding Zn-ribbon protein involved in translation (DUF1610 family)